MFRPDHVAALRAQGTAPHITDSAADPHQGDLARLSGAARPEDDGLPARLAPLFRARREEAGATA